MDTNSMFALMDLLVVGCGVYVLYAYYLLIAKNEIKEGILLPKDVNPKKCTDLEGYKKYMGPKILIMGIAACITGGLGLYQDYVAQLGTYPYLIVLAVFFGIMIWFIVAIKKSEKRFW